MSTFNDSIDTNISNEPTSEVRASAEQVASVVDVSALTVDTSDDRPSQPVQPIQPAQTPSVPEPKAEPMVPVANVPTPRQPVAVEVEADRAATVPDPAGDKPQNPTPQPKNPKWAGYVALILAVCIILVFGGGYVLQQTGWSFHGGTRPAPTKPAPTTVVDERQKSFSLEQSAQKADRTDAKALSTIEIAKKGRPSVVAILTEKQMQMFNAQFNEGKVVRQAAGSGFVISKDGYIVTNAHVVKDAKKITVQMFDNKSFEAKLIGLDVMGDIAVIKVEATDLTPATLGSSATLEVGELAVAIGNPTGELNGTVTAGIISALDRTIKVPSSDELEISLSVLQTDATINPGNSGGALFNSFGEVIGINTAKAQGSGESLEGLGFAIPIDLAKPIVEQLINHGYIKDRAFIGISGVPINKATADFYGLTPGVMVNEVEPDSPAAKAGVKAKDIIVRMDDKEIADIFNLRTFLAQHKAGDKVTITVVRGNREMSMPLTLGADMRNAKPAADAKPDEAKPTTPTAP